MTYSPVANGDPVLGPDVQQIIDGITGSSVETHYFKGSSTSQYAVTVQSIDTTNGYIFRCINSAGTVIFGVTQSGFTGTDVSDVGEYNVLDYGAVGDVRTWQSYGSVTSGSTTVSLLSAATGFTSTDVGKVICVTNGSASVVTTVQAFLNATSVNMATTASFTSSTAQVLCGTDSTAAGRAAWTAAEAAHGGTVYWPAGTYFVGKAVWADAGGINVRGEPGINTADSGGAEHVALTHRGTHILALPGTTGTWIDFSGNTGSGIEGIVFGRSDQSNWAALNVGILMLAKSGKECVENYLNDGWITGTYTTASMYLGSVNQGDSKRWRYYNYSSYTGATCLSLTASNWNNITSANLTVNSVTSWNETRSWVFERCQMHSVISGQNPDAARPDVAAIYLDGVWDMSFKDCDITSVNAAVKWTDADTTTQNHLSRMVTFSHCNIEHPDQSPSAAGLALYALPLWFILAGTNAPMRDWTIESCRARLHTADGTAYASGVSAMTTVTTVGAWIAENGSASTAVSFQRLNVIAPWNYNNASANYLFGMFSNANTAVQATRFVGCTVDFAGLASVMRGVADGACRWNNPGTLTFDSYANAGIRGETARPRFPTGLQVDTSLYNATGTALLSFTGPNLTAEAPFIPMTLSGTAVANALYKDMFAKANITFNGTGTSLSAVNAAVSRTSTGAYTVTFPSPFSTGTYRVLVTVESDSGGFGHAVVSNKSVSSVRIFTKNTGGTLADLDVVHVACFGPQ